MMGIIYKYTSPSGKVYIGQTKRTIQERAKDKNGSGYKQCVIFYAAIKKYGFENFKVDIIEECENSLLNEKEKYWIMYYDSTNREKGYNIQEGGGERPDVSKKICQYSKEKQLIKTYDSITAAAKELHCSISLLSQCVHGKKISCKGYYWSFEGELPKFKTMCKKQVYQFDEYGNLVKEFESARNADRYYGLVIGTVKQCANKKQGRKRVNGMIFTYEPILDINYYKPLKFNDYPKGE